MSDIVKIIFDADLGPLQAKQAVAKGQLNAFVVESEAEIKGITSAGAAIGAASQKGAESFSRYYKPVLADTRRDLLALQAGFERVLGAEGSQAARAGLDDLGTSLTKLNLKGYESAASSEVLNLELRKISRTLKQYQFDLATASAENIFFTETEAAAAVATKTRADVMGKSPLRGYGGVFQATGLTNAGINETEANAALNIVSKLGISVSSLVAIGGVAALGAAAIGVSEKLNSEADARLASEERIASSINKQVIGLREALSDYEKIKDQLQQNEALQRKIAGLIGQSDSSGVKDLRDKTDQDNIAKITEINRLQADLRYQEQALAFEKGRTPRGALGQAVFGGTTASQQRQSVGEAESAVDRTKKRLAEAEDDLRRGTGTLKELDNAQSEITKNQDARFAAGFANRVKNLEDEKRFNDKLAAERKAAAEKFKQSVKDANEEVTRLSAGYKDEFNRLFLDNNRDNPFATQIIQSAKALEVLDQKLKGVGPELRRQAIDLQTAAAAQQVYTTQINSAFQNVDLRNQRDRFRNPTQQELQYSFNDRAAERERISNSTNPDVLASKIVDAFKAGTINREEAIKQFNTNFSGYSPDVLRQFRDTIRNTFTDEQVRNQRVVDEKIDIAGRAKTEVQKAIADAALTSFAGGLNPDDLTKSERARIADAFERSAVRNEARQEQALRVQQDLLATLTNIDKRGEALAKVANEKGKEGLEATIRIVDETANGVQKDVKPQRPTGADVANIYNGNFGSAGGAGGLTNL